MNKFILAGGAALAIGVGAYVLQTTSSAQEAQITAPPEGAPLVEVTVPAQFSEAATLGKTGFDAVCAACHGTNGAGKLGFGPPLVHKIYEPSHHGDMAFYVAVQQGVRAHHWPFGNMPPQEGLTKADVTNIISYVRELQRANGIN